MSAPPPPPLGLLSPPLPGGVVRKVSPNSITLLVLGCISVAIERANIPSNWEYDLHVSL